MSRGCPFFEKCITLLIFRTQLVILGLLPCPKFDIATKELFKSTSFELRKITKNFSCCSFVKISSGFVHLGHVDASLFHQDGIHLNEAGVKIFTERVVRHIEALPKFE
jgi:lysophospholipase L1-like esterase